MRILLKRTLELVVYRSENKSNTLIVAIMAKEDGMQPIVVAELNEEEEKWKDELAEILHIPKEKLEL